MAPFGSLAPDMDAENELLSKPKPDVDWSRYNQPLGELTVPRGGEVIGTLGKGTPYESPITRSDVDKAMDIGLSFSGGGLATKVPKPTVGARQAFQSWADALTGNVHAPETAGPAAAEAGMAAAPGSLPADVSRGAGGGDARVSEAQARAKNAAGAYAALPGLPENPVKVGDQFYIPGPIGKVKDVANSYMQGRVRSGSHPEPEIYHPLDKEHSANVAQAYEEMAHAPNDPAVKASYEAMIKETLDQYRHIRANHPELQIEPIVGEDPYAANPRMAAMDVAHNNHLWFFPTESGYGTDVGDPSAVKKISDNPLLRPSGETLNGKPLLNNDLFRVVHDYFGHLKEGYGFRAAGEDNAWRSHASMYSDLARPAMTSETRGQNSWVNYGPHGETNRAASAGDTRYADQKVGIMPEWTMRDRGSPEAIATSPGYTGQVGTFKNLSGPVDEAGNYAYHATNEDRAQDIARGSLKRARPGDYTDQDTWPDGATERRNYFTPTARNTWQFAPDEGKPVLLRIPRDAHPFKSERRTGDLYSTKDVDPDKIEALGESGWAPLKNFIAAEQGFKGGS